MTKNKGFSLIELIIAMTLGLFLILAITGVFISNKHSFRIEQAVSELQDNSRFVSQYLTREIKQAGFASCAGLQGLAPDELKQPIRGYTADSSGNIDLFGDGATVIQAKPDSDAIAITSSGHCGGTVISTPLNRNSAINIANIENCNWTSGMILAITNCKSIDVVTASYVTQTGNAFKIKATETLSTLYGPGAMVFPVQQALYYVKTDPATNEDGLYQFRNGTEELVVEGIEDLKITYGLDTNDSSTVDTYESASTIISSDWKHVISIETKALIRSTGDNLAIQPQQVEFDGMVNVAGDKRMRKALYQLAFKRNY